MQVPVRVPTLKEVHHKIHVTNNRGETLEMARINSAEHTHRKDLETHRDPVLVTSNTIVVGRLNLRDLEEFSGEAGAEIDTIMIGKGITDGKTRIGIDDQMMEDTIPIVTMIVLVIIASMIVVATIVITTDTVTETVDEIDTRIMTENWTVSNGDWLI